jgi:drug/metabolite transporter (DMT)-like permease
MYKTLFLTILSLLAFAGNSVICRLALKDGLIDAYSFTTIRLISGALFLFFLVLLKNRFRYNWGEGSWLGAFFLFAYAAFFSFSYISLDTGVGALILFGSVQISMISFSIFKGKKLVSLEYLGLITAFSGLAFLLLPGASSPPLFGFLLMVLSGIAWGGYTLIGKNSSNPLSDTANNFLRSIPFVLVFSVFMFKEINIETYGILLAVLSGTITSGLGYAIWYSALENLQISLAAIVQLLVPIIAALGGVVFSAEEVSLQLFVSSLLILGGIFLVIRAGMAKP